MKYSILLIAVLLVAFIVFQSFMFHHSNNIETYPYKVLKKYEGFEIREYESRNFIYVNLPESSYNASSGKGFQYLAGYIFGGNDRQEKIAMTCPVSMNIEDSVTMMFMLPEKYDLDELPIPNDAEVKFKTEPVKIVAAIRFGGWANDSKIKEHSKKLSELLSQHKLKHKDSFSYFGYNPPYEVINRKNEVIVELMPNQLDF